MFNDNVKEVTVEEAKSFYDITKQVFNNARVEEKISSLIINTLDNCSSCIVIIIKPVNIDIITNDVLLKSHGYFSQGKKTNKECSYSAGLVSSLYQYKECIKQKIHTACILEMNSLEDALDEYRKLLLTKEEYLYFRPVHIYLVMSDGDTVHCVLSRIL